MTIKQRLQKLKKKYPYNTVSVSYEGSGDSFDSFWNTQFSPETINATEIENNFIQDAEDLLCYALDNSDANFDNEGCTGVIIFDFANLTLSIRNNHYVTDVVPGDYITFENKKL